VRLASLDGDRIRLTLTNLGAEPIHVLQLDPWVLDDGVWSCLAPDGVPAGPAWFRSAAGLADSDGWIEGGASVQLDLASSPAAGLWAAVIETRSGARSWVGVVLDSTPSTAAPAVVPDAPSKSGMWVGLVAMVLVATAIAALLVRSPDVAPRPNIVLLVADDMGWADTSLHGDDRFPMPHLERLAAEGVRFTQGYATASVCSPSRAAMLTGRYQQRFGHEFNPPPVARVGIGLPDSVTLLSERLVDLGYDTAAIGKWHLGIDASMHPLRRGFGQWFGFLRGERPHLPTDGLPSQKRLFDGTRMLPEDFDTVTDALGERAAAFIRGQGRNPFFLYLSFDAVHTPLQATPSDLEAVDPSLEGDRRTLAAMTRALDRNVGRVLDALDRQHIADDTLVFFVNDNGGGSRNGSDNRPLRGHKGQIHEGGHRVATVLRWTSTLPAGVFTEPVSTLDIVPTALAAVGVDLPDDLDGVDLRPWLDGSADEDIRPHEVLYWRLGDSWAIRAGDFKLSSDQGGPVALFNLAVDPSERVDLAATDPRRVRELQELWDAWSQSMQAPAFAGNRDRSQDRIEQRPPGESP
jgi:arylsulfatase A-like enzyme